MKFSNTIIFCISLLSIEYSYSCTTNQETVPPKYINGKWVQQTQLPKQYVTDYPQMINRFSIIFSGKYYRTFNDNHEQIKILYVNDIWKGHVPKSFEIEKLIDFDDGACGRQIFSGQKYIFLAETGTRKNPIILMKAVQDNSDLIQILGKPRVSWIQ